MGNGDRREGERCARQPVIVGRVRLMRGVVGMVALAVVVGLEGGDERSR